MDSSIDLLITGGTLDKDYAPLTGELIFDHTHLPSMLQQANCTLAIQTQVVMLKDSLDMTLEDREQLNQLCEQAGSRIVITHGTDTMVDTAIHLQSNPSLHHKTIILTGAMRPFKLGQSDALFNLGAALMACQLTNKGIFISMNGQLFAADQVQKNRQIGVFEIQ